MMDDDWWYTGVDGYGQIHDLRGADDPPPRLYGLRSVSKAAVWALYDAPKAKSRPIGFRFPKPRR